MWQARSFCCLFEDCLRISLFISFPLCVFFFPENEASHSGSTFCLGSTDVKEPLVWTVIPLKPWAEPYPDTPDAISNPPPHTPPPPKHTPRRMCGFVSLTTLRRIQKGTREKHFAFQMSLYHCTSILIRNSTQLDSLRVFGSLWWREGGTAGGTRLDLLETPSAGGLSATCNLKDCSTDALQLCINYAKWPNQLLFPSSAWRARLWMHCPLCLSVVRNNSRCPPSVSFLFFFFLLRCGKKTKRSDFEHSISVWFVSFSSVRWHKRLLEFLKDNRCFSYFSWFVICCKCCKTVGLKKSKKKKTVYNSSQQPFFWRDLSVEPDFVKALLYWFLIHACCSYTLNNKT